MRKVMVAAVLFTALFLMSNLTWAVSSNDSLLAIGPYHEKTDKQADLVRLDLVDMGIDQPDNRDSRYGGWGGFSIGWFFPDLDGFQGMTEERGLDGFKAPLRMWQGKGFVNINGFRIGGMGGGGAFHEVESINGDERWASLDIIYGGFYMGYHLPVTDQLGLFGGVTLGGGMAWMAADGDDIGDYWSQFETFDYTAPEAGISVKVTDWFRVETAAQYNYFGLDTNGSSFYAENGGQMVDLDQLSGFSVSLWFLFGYGG